MNKRLKGLESLLQSAGRGGELVVLHSDGLKFSPDWVWILQRLLTGQTWLTLVTLCRREDGHKMGDELSAAEDLIAINGED